MTSPGCTGTTQKPPFPYNKTSTRTLNTILLKCCLPSTDTIDRWEKIHACIWRFKVISCKHASLKYTRFLQKVIRSDTFLIEYYYLHTLLAWGASLELFVSPNLSCDPWKSLIPIHSLYNNFVVYTSLPEAYLPLRALNSLIGVCELKFNRFK